MYKAAIIGAGVIGAMTARRLSAYDIPLVILEKEADVAMGQSKANSGIVHAGYDPVPGSLKAKLNVEGNRLMEQACSELGVPFRRNGTLVTAFSGEDLKALELLLERGIKNGVKGLRLIDGDEARAMEKNLSQRVKGALYAPTGGIVCPYELTVESVGNAMDNGCELVRNFEVCCIKRNEDSYSIISEDGREVRAEYVINCAGIYSDKIASMAGDDSFKITPRAGEYMLLDKEAAYLTDMTVFKVPDMMGKGVLAIKTVDGNILLGPTSVDRECKEDTSVTDKGLDFIVEKENMFFDHVPLDKVIGQFAGLRAHGDKGDFIINMPLPKFVNAAGIESPGLTSAPAVARMIEDMMLEDGFTAAKKPDFNPVRSHKKHFRDCTVEEKNILIKENPDYGQIVCRCEEITKGEIVEAIRRNPGAVDVDGVKRRTRTGMGRCQGGFCLGSVLEILAKELETDIENIEKKGKNSNIVLAKLKGGRR